MKYLLVFFVTLTLFSYAKAAEWTYRLKVIDETQYNSLLGKKLTEKDLESVTTVREIKVQGPDTLPSPALQNDTFVVCQVACPGEKNAMATAKPTKQSGGVVEFFYPVESAQFRQVNLFYHLNYAWNKFAELGYKPAFQKQIKIRSDRKITQLLEKGDMSNNAFFDDTDNSLNFVPSKTVLILMGLLGKKNFIDTAYDPIVMAHELGHLVIHDSIGRVPTSDFGGIHEGLADFFALNFYRTTNQGIIFGAGTPIRSATGKEQYKIGMEVHDRGLVLVQSLFEMESVLAKSASIQEITKSTFDSLECLKQEYHRVLPAMVACFLDQPVARNQQDTLVRYAENHQIPVKSYMDATRQLPSNLKLTSYIITLDSLDGADAYYAKIEAGRAHGNLGLFRVQTKSTKSAEYSHPTFVLANLTTGQVFSSWDAQGHRITYSNSAAYKGIAENSKTIEDRIELEKGDSTGALGQSDEKARAVQYKVGDTSIAAKQLKMGKMSIFTMNMFLKAIGMNMKFHAYEEVKADNPTLDILKTFPTLYSNIDIELKLGKDSLRAPVKHQVLEAGKIQ
ncbi:hypothetical protein B9G69_003185 [Bdellovibrio sp. SKB1291214]|uniref:hypothetical protein n=1 Tax=Bdellovibrio sp. SKB1291214 TaxID=1732569 RepID=UPI000B516C61|nr:hypothetical protein [Bdellovibrio sp. SKB1291214]UYL09575.1 hypothetical protein B9G69_003185 [Bdellovibrio sp. SKB1291214]